MKTLTSLFRPAVLLAALPAVLAFSACSNDDDDNSTPTPDQGKVLISHAAASANIPVKALVNDTEVAQLTYSQTTNGYLNVNAGSPTLKINNSANQTAATQQVTIAKDQNYSVFAYAPTATTVGLAAFTDDLTAPASGQAKVRIVHLALNAPTPVKLSQLTVAGATDVPNASAVFGAASAFVSIPATSYNLLVTTGSASTPVVVVGDGTGNSSPTASKNYEAGKIYTVVVRGIAGNLDPALQPKAVVIQHN